MTVAAVTLWGTRVGAVSVEGASEVAAFQYDQELLRTGVELAPLQMPLRGAPYTFPGLPEDAFRGLPGMLADALPDKYGTALVNAWLAAQGREPSSFDVVERLCYIGTRGMGALEFHPAREPAKDSGDLHIARLVELASAVLSDREEFIAELAHGDDTQAMRQILSVGTSAGGARAKAVIAYNDATGQVRSGQVDAGDGFRHWLLKFDGVDDNRDKGDLADPKGWGAVEYAYHLMAIDAGINMTECRLLEEGGRRHFMTRRFDRSDTGAKRHMQTLGAVAHLDYNQPGAHSYEQALMVIRQLSLSVDAVQEQFRRMVFNVVARNQDDHVKNIAFLMATDGRWALSPAYDLTFAHEPGNQWLKSHQMTVNGKRDRFTVADLRAVAGVAGLKRSVIEAALADVVAAVGRWKEFAAVARVDDATAQRMARAHRLRLPSG